MKLYNFRAKAKVQQCLKHVLTASEPNSTYDAVIIGGGMNLHFDPEDYIFYDFSCVALFTDANRKMLNVQRGAVGNVTAYKVEFAGSRTLTIIIT
jgi:hypothetical protein